MERAECTKIRIYKHDSPMGSQEPIPTRAKKINTTGLRSPNAMQNTPYSVGLSGRQSPHITAVVGMEGRLCPAHQGTELTGSFVLRQPLSAIPRRLLEQQRQKPSW